MNPFIFIILVMSKIQYDKDCFVEIQGNIGSGGYGTVLKALWTRGQQTMEVAAKTISLESEEKKSYGSLIQREIDILNSFNEDKHPNLMRMLDYFEHKGKYYFLLPLC